MSKNNIETALELVGKLPELARAAKGGSLIEYTQATRVEPIVLMDEKVSNLSMMPDVMQTLTSIFAGYYLQAVALSVNVGSVNVLSLLDSLNPDRDPWFSGAEAAKGWAMEQLSSYEYGLPLPGEAVGLEHFGIESKSESKYSKDAVTNKDSLQVVRTPSNLAVGKLIEVNIESNGQKATFPISIRMIPVMAKSVDMVRTMSIGSTDISFMGRIHAWRSGQIEFVKDLILCQDLITDHKKGLIKDDGGIYTQTMKRKNKNRLSALFSKTISVSTASNILIISESTKKELERQINGKLKHFKTREKMFSDTYTMLLVVIDPDWEGITIYHRSIETETEVTASDMKQMGKKDVDVGEILKAYTLGNAPSF